MNKTGSTQNTRKKQFILLLLVVVGSAIFITFSETGYSLPLSEKKELSYNQIAKAIKAKYDQNLDSLNNYKASHYATRIYRISGDTTYLSYNLQDLQRMKENVEKLMLFANDNNEIEFSKIRTNGWSSGERVNLRRASLTIAPAFPYYLSSLNILRRAQEYRVCSTQFERLKEHILAHNYTHELSDPIMIKAWAPQLANVVAWIKQLGGKDYSDVFIKAMRQVYPNSQDHLLSTQQYENKLYGLTHIILAGSQYYQYAVNRSDFVWIYDYFDTHIDVIISRAKTDVVVEIGIAYLLAGEYNNPALEKTRQNIMQHYDEFQQMIPSLKGSFDIANGAHRNILAIMLLSSPKRFYQGPQLDQVLDTVQLPEAISNCLPSQHSLTQGATAKSMQ